MTFLGEGECGKIGGRGWRQHDDPTKYARDSDQELAIESLE